MEYDPIVDILTYVWTSLKTFTYSVIRQGYAEDV